MLRNALQSALSYVSPAVLIDRVDAIERAFSMAGDVAGAASAGRMTQSTRHFFMLVSDALRDPHHRWQLESFAVRPRRSDRSAALASADRALASH
jgi:hypothetical protein